MKIGILTFHYAHNYGAALQAFALKYFLCNNGHEAFLINYRNTKVSNNYVKKLKVNHKIDKICLSNIKKITTSYLDYFFARKQWKKQYNAFVNFQQQYLTNAKTPIGIEQLSCLGYDAFVAGSDQIWNKSITGGYDNVYFLNFITKAKKIFYAPSTGYNFLSSEDCLYMKNAINSKMFISVREDSIAEEIKLKLHLDAIGVVDPCFLLKKGDYINSFNLKKINQNKYLFAYFVYEDPMLKKMVEIISESLNLDVVELHYYKTRFLRHPYQRADMGPVEFLSYIYGADFVLTNSFHGTAFAIIFEKDFYSVYKKDARKDTLLKGLNLQNRHIYCFKDMCLGEHINYCDINLDNYVMLSKSYLLNSLK